MFLLHIFLPLLHFYAAGIMWHQLRKKDVTHKGRWSEDHMHVHKLNMLQIWLWDIVSVKTVPTLYPNHFHLENESSRSAQNTCTLPPNTFNFIDNKNIHHLYRLHRAFFSLSNINKCTYIVFNNLKFASKHLKRSNMFRSYDHPQGAYFVPC